jgi:hypothetical protein
MNSITQPKHGTAVLSNDKSTITYTPTADFNGADTFTYTVLSADNKTGTATVHVTVTPTNDDPNAIDDAYRVYEHVATDLAVLDNDKDIDGDNLVVSAIASAPSHGTATIIESGKKIQYTSTGSAEADSFTYTITDPSGKTDTATVNITIVYVNDPPTATNDAYTIDETDVDVVMSVLDNDSDPDTGNNVGLKIVDARVGSGFRTRLSHGALPLLP